MKIKTTARNIALGGIVTTVGVLGTLGLVSAQDASEVESEVRGEVFLTRLAENLGVSDEELNIALKDSRISIVEDKVLAGEITEDQGEELISMIEESERGILMRERRSPKVPASMKEDFERPLLDQAQVADIAEVLELDVEELYQRLAAGEKLRDIIAESDVEFERGELSGILRPDFE